MRYRINYQNKLFNQIGGVKKLKYNYILLDGTSSAGKSTICDYFSEHGFTCIKGDDFSFCNPIFEKNWNRQKSKLPNKYISKDESNTFDRKLRAKLMKEEALKYNKAILDWVVPEYIIKEFKNANIKLQVILLYTSLSNLARNMISRKKKEDPRQKFVFKQYAKRYEKTDKKKDSIDTVNRSDFKKILLKNFKMEFSDKKELIDFTNEIFKLMNIEDDETHYVKIRDKFEYDYLLNTNNKSKNDLINELNKLFN